MINKQGYIYLFIFLETCIGAVLFFKMDLKTVNVIHAGKISSCLNMGSPNLQEILC